MVQTIVLTIVFILTVANLLFLWLLYRDVLQKMSDYDHQLKELKVDTSITEAFSEESHNHEDLNKLANDLFIDVKKTFGLEGRTFSEFVELLKDKPVKNKKLKDALLHFFDRIVIYSYRDVDISDEDKEQLKQEFKLIQDMIDQHKSESQKTKRKK